MRKVFKLILIILMFLFSYKITYSEEKNLIMIITKKYLLKKNYYLIHLKSVKNILMKHLLNYF